VDEDSKTSPFASVQARKDYHFTTQDRRDDLWNTFESSGSIRDLGTYLHPEQDSFSHAGYGPVFGHAVAGHAPDKTYNDPLKADRMAKDTYERLRAAADRLGIDKSNSVAWQKIDKLVGAFNRARTPIEKSKILAELIEVIRQAQIEAQKKKKKSDKPTGGTK
jgi:hypothetical protein